ncbi:hypothetical protein C1A50_2333 [Paenibacillus polymyxa]|nr:hypothetical protein C1A50_2333 [Paenibacillus polymyxa]
MDVIEVNSVSEMMRACTEKLDFNLRWKMHHGGWFYRLLLRW